jgi:hypothetical protein
MGIEPTWDFVEPHAGFEDQERHQAALHLHLPESETAIAKTGNLHTIRWLRLPPFGCSTGVSRRRHIWGIARAIST